MLAYVARRLGALVIILFGSSFIIYNLTAISSDPLEGLRDSTAPNRDQLILNLTRDLRLDLPPPIVDSEPEDVFERPPPTKE